MDSAPGLVADWQHREEEEVYAEMHADLLPPPGQVREPCWRRARVYDGMGQNGGKATNRTPPKGKTERLPY
jgi:hypothetical protein